VNIYWLLGGIAIIAAVVSGLIYLLGGFFRKD
jgi:hypothetical protein